MTQAHLSDDRLIEIALLEAPSAAEQHHISACTRCDSRRSRMLGLLDETTAAITAEADAAFPAERLARQQARILAHLQQDGRPAKVIAFPAGHSHEPFVSRTRPGTRWIAAAAAAGLVVGVFAGRLGHDVSSSARPGVASAIVARAAEPAELGATGTTATLREVSTAVSDEEFLSQIELAIDGPAAAALQPLDELTPRAWDVR